MRRTCRGSASWRPTRGRAGSGPTAWRPTRTSWAACWPSASSSSRAPRADGRWTRLIRMAVFGLGVAALFLTFSRAAWIAFAVGLAVAIVMLAIRRDRPGRPAMGRGGADGRRHRCRPGRPVRCHTWRRGRTCRDRSRPRPARSTNGWRTPISGCASIAEHPLLGTGLGTMPQAMRLADPTFDYAFQPAHVVIVDVAAETGLAGALCYLVLVVAPWVALVRARRRWTRWLAGASAGDRGGHGRRPVRLLPVDGLGRADLGVDPPRPVGRRVPGRARARSGRRPGAGSR